MIEMIEDQETIQNHTTMEVKDLPYGQGAVHLQHGEDQNT